MNLEHNRRVIMMTGCNEWDAGLDVVVEGEAVHAKWDGRWHYQVSNGRFRHTAGEALVFSPRPSKASA